MEANLSQFSWFAELPSEILFEIFNLLNRIHLAGLTSVNKRIHSLAQYVLEHRKKIRLCGNNLRVLVLSLRSRHDMVDLGTDGASGPNGATSCIPRAALVANKIAYRRSTRPSFHMLATRAHAVDNSGKQGRMTMIVPPMEKKLRKELWLAAVEADIILFIVDPDEIDEHSSEIKELIFGSCFMMSARNVIVAVDLRDYSLQDSSWNHPFNQAKDKMTKLLNSTVGMCYKIVPVNVKTGDNITDHQTSPGVPSLMQLLREDQLRTNFDESAFQKLCEEPLKIQAIHHYMISGIGTVIKGHVISGVIRPGDQIMICPKANKSEIRTIEEYYENVAEAKPGAVIACNVRLMARRDLTSFSYLINPQQTPLINCTIAFRASMVVMKSDRFTQHQTFTVVYGSAHIRCVLWWIFPEGKSHNKDKRKFKPQCTLPIKPELRYYSRCAIDIIKRLKSEYKCEVAKAKEKHVKEQIEKGKVYVRPPKPMYKRAKAILLPLIHHDIETYKPSVFEKNYTGKVMLVEKGSIVAVGRVDRIIRYSTHKSEPLLNSDYRDQYDKVIAQAAQLFNLPTEQNQLEMFLEHVNNNTHAKKCIQEQNSLSWWAHW